MTSPTDRSTLTAEDVASWLLCAAAFGFGAWGLGVGWSHGILDVHAWRQSHTAISAYEMAFRGGPFWAYRTPIFGPPWRWPLEFPLHQALAALITRLLAVDLERAGRAVSVAFYAAAFIPGWFALDVFELRPRHRPIVLALVWASPLYIFWSRTFMIESTALCFAVSYFALAHRATRPGAAPSMPLLAWAAAAGAIGGATKVTTLAAFVAAAAVMTALRSRRAGWPRRAQAAVLIALFVMPIAATGAWLAFADHLKNAGPLAAEIDFSAEREQRFGTVAERFQPRSWYAAPANLILGRTRHAVIGSGAVFALALLAALSRRRRRLATLGCLACYLLPIAIFMRLFVVHVYYSYENGLLLAVAAGCGIVTCLEGPRVLRLGGVALFAAGLTAAAGNYLTGYYVDQAAGDLAPMAMAAITRAHTAPDEVMLIYGLDYSPALPYAAGRRAIMDSKDRSIDDPAIRATLDNLAAAGGRLGVIVSCGGSRRLAPVRDNIRRLGFADRPFHAEPFCDLFLRR